MALAHMRIGRRTRTVFMLGVAGAALFYGDAIITPAISVLSAVEGLKLAIPRSSRTGFMPVAIGILIALFAAQARGTGKVGLVFGPLMAGLVSGARGARRDRISAMIRRSLRRSIPRYAFGFLCQHGVARLRRAWLGVPGRDRRRGAVCRHGTFRPHADPDGLALAGVSLPRCSTILARARWCWRIRRRWRTRSS